jgi:thiamine-monophosphate kinase
MPSEFELIARYFSPPTDHTILAGGDDAALIEVSPGMALAVSTDMLVAGRHFFEDADPFSIGLKSLAVNLSDLAAMGATPRWATLSLAIPAADEQWLAAFSSGFLSLARRYRVDLIGGDTTRGPLTICVQIMGEVPQGLALMRSGAQTGDDVWVSGTLGDATLALAHLNGEIALSPEEFESAKSRLERPEARVALGEALRGIASAAIDISDGFVADLGHVTERSRVRAIAHLEAIPRSPLGLRYKDLPVGQRCALAGGDDYELCFTSAPVHRARLEELARRLQLPLTRAGRIEAGEGVLVIDAQGQPVSLRERGFDHFG